MSDGKDDDENNKGNFAEYMKVMADVQGCGVATVSDGWVLLFKREWLLQQLEGSTDEHLVIFVKSSAKQPKN